MVFYKGNNDNAIASDVRHGACIAYTQNREVRMKKYKEATTSSTASNCYNADYNKISGCPTY